MAKVQDGVNNETITYTYDLADRLVQIQNSNLFKTKYTYDNNSNVNSRKYLLNELEETITYTYDNGGNLLNKKEYAYTESNLGEETGTINYSYENTNWKDQLTSYNGKAITYDNIGNPLTYDGNTYTWQNGRQLTGISNTAKEQTITYKYNDEGIRTEKVVNGIASKYYLEGTKVIYEMTGTNLSYYQYDEQGNIIGMQYNGTQYYYIKNLQGDIIGILDNELNQVVKYDYDSWGKVIAITDATGTEITDQSHIGNINPYRYRSYRYDRETGLYYLQSRYYNPEWGRFLNADGLVATGQEPLGHNMYSYSYNNPINLTDKNGNSAIAGILISLGSLVLKPAIAVGISILLAGGAYVGNKAKETVSEKIEESMNERNTVVYKLVDEQEKVQYVGRTKNPKTRAENHRKNPARAHLRFEKVEGMYTPIEARGLEQLLIMHYSTLNRNNPTNNQINGIRWDHPYYASFIAAAQMVFPESETYVGP